MLGFYYISIERSTTQTGRKCLFLSEVVLSNDDTCMVLNMKWSVLIECAEVVCVKGNCFFYTSETFIQPAACDMF